MKRALKAVVPPVPRLSLRRRSRRFTSADDDDEWSDDEQRSSSTRASVASASSRAAPPRTRAATVSTARRPPGGSTNGIPRPITSLLSKGSAIGAISTESSKRCAAVGRSRALLDVGKLVFFILALREALPPFFHALSSSPSSSALIAALTTMVVESNGGWAWHALAASVLCAASDAVWFVPALRRTVMEATDMAEYELRYAQLYLRLTSGLPVQRRLGSDAVKQGAESRALFEAGEARLRTFCGVAGMYVLFVTVVGLWPAVEALGAAVSGLVDLEVWRTLGRGSVAADWAAAMGGAKAVGFTLVHRLRMLLVSEMDIVRREPLRVVAVATLLAALVGAAYLPSLEARRKSSSSNNNAGEDDGEDEDEDADAAEAMTSLWSSMGASSAARLTLLSSPRGVEGALERFADLRPKTASAMASRRRKRRPSRDISLVDGLRSLRPHVRQLAYSASSLVILAVPLVVFFVVFAKENMITTGDDAPSLSSLLFSSGMSSISIPEHGWKALSSTAVLLYFVHVLVRDAVHHSVRATNARLGHSATSFFRTLAGTVGEVQKSLAATATDSGNDAAPQSPSSNQKGGGLIVTDLWAAHVSRRAWAVQGATVHCRSGEVVLVLGTDGSGKSRLLTAITERLFVPPNAARTTKFVRGTMHVCGKDVTGWDRVGLQRRVGVVLNDVRTVADSATLMSGCTLEEILEPVPLVGAAVGKKSNRIGVKEKNAMEVAMRVSKDGMHMKKACCVLILID